LATYWKRFCAPTEAEQKNGHKGSLFTIVGKSPSVGQLLLDTSRLTTELAQVVEFGLAHVTAALDLDAVNQRTVSLARSLNSHTVRDLANSECRVQQAVMSLHQLGGGIRETLIADCVGDVVM
jgi:hypothetical protein